MNQIIMHAIHRDMKMVKTAAHFKMEISPINSTRCVRIIIVVLGK